MNCLHSKKSYCLTDNHILGLLLNVNMPAGLEEKQLPIYPCLISRQVEPTYYVIYHNCFDIRKIIVTFVIVS